MGNARDQQSEGRGATEIDSIQDSSPLPYHLVLSLLTAAKRVAEAGWSIFLAFDLSISRHKIRGSLKLV